MRHGACSCKITRLIFFAWHALTSPMTFSAKYNNEINGLQMTMKAKSQDISVARAGGALLSYCQFSRQRIPTLNYAKAPTYQLSYGIGTLTQMDYRLMQRETVALTQMLLDLSRVPYADLRKETAP